MTKHKWTAAQRAKFTATMRQKQQDETDHFSHLDPDEQGPDERGRYSDPRLDPIPEFIYVLMNGALKRFQLRQMTIYVPSEELKP